MDNSALVPDGLELSAEPIRDAEDAIIKVAESVDKDYAELKMIGGWNRIAKEMQADIDKLRNLRGTDIAKKDYAEVGQMFLVASLTADHLQKYLDKVENAAKAVADAARSKQPK